MSKVSNQLIKTIGKNPEFNGFECLHCGSCTALCPLEKKLLPRRVFRLVILGLEEELIKEKDSIYSCLLCKLCEQNCPAGVHIAENIRIIRNYFNKHVFKLIKE